MSEEPELTPEEERRMLQDLDQGMEKVMRLLDQAFGDASGDASNRVTLARMCHNMEHLLVERALAEGVAPHVTMEALDLSMEADGPLVWCVSRNMFTLLLILGIVRDPEILQALTMRTPNESTGGWEDRFTDERGSWMLRFTPPDRYDAMIVPTATLDYIHVKLDLPKDPE